MIIKLKIQVIHELSKFGIKVYADLSIEGATHFGGEYSNGKYEFNITRYFNNLLNNDSYTNQLYLLASGGAVNANRTIIDNSSIKISILYSAL